MKKVCVLTAARAEYGLLKNTIIHLKKYKDIKVHIAVTGMHLSVSYGETYKEIEEDGIEINKKIYAMPKDDTPKEISKSMGKTIAEFAGYFDKDRPDLLVVLGDRYETFAVCIAAMNEAIPIAHIHGGEITEGAVDDSIRHAITKLSYLHFTAAEEYRKRVIQLGEAPERVFCIGSPGVENIMKTVLFTKEDLEKELSISLSGSYALVTFHPATLEYGEGSRQVKQLIQAMKQHRELTYIITKSNADAGGAEINSIWEEAADINDNFFLYDSLGMKRYLSLMKNAAAVIGNSSSGIIEAPAFKVPTVNIGERQKGRLMAESILCCNASASEIDKKINEALSEKMLETLKTVKSLYGDGNVSEKISAVIYDYLINDKLQKKKIFYNC